MNKYNPIVGVWYVRAIDAPFEHHVFTFYADGIMAQANPDAGDPATSDSDGMGIWKVKGEKIIGKFVEITADRKTHKFVSRGEINFTIKVDGDTFDGIYEAKFYDREGSLQRSALPAKLSGTRVKI